MSQGSVSGFLSRSVREGSLRYFSSVTRILEFAPGDGSSRNQFEGWLQRILMTSWWMTGARIGDPSMIGVGNFHQ
jgi:hypothetical protein